MSPSPKENNFEKSNLKKFPYPECWEDKSTMLMMFSTFRLRHLNTENYDSKMKFWMDLITQYCNFAGKAYFSLRELQLHFVKGDQLPACLDTVIEEMHRQKQIRLRSEYEYDPENTWSGWAMNSFLKRPMSWGWRKLKHSIISEDLVALSMVEWVHLNVLNAQCDDLYINVLEPNRGKLFHFDAFKSLCNECLVRIHPESLQMCLLTLHMRRKLGLEYTNDKQTQRRIHLVKIPTKVDGDISVGEVDHTLHDLQITQANLLKQLEDLEEEVKVADDKARMYVKMNQRQMAKTYLRKRHLLEKNHERRSIALHNIEMLLSSMEEAQNSGVVLEAYKTGTQTLKKVLNDSGLKYNNVDEVLSDVRETLDEHREVQDIMSNDALNITPHDEDELERELREIMGEAPKNTSITAVLDNKERPEIVISDEELIAMLDDLDVEDGRISTTGSINNKSNLYSI